MKYLAMLFLALQLAACAGFARNGPAVAVYDFGLPAVRLVDDKVKVWSKLAIKVKAPDWFDLHAISYRLAYADSLKLHVYAESRWAGPPAELLAQRLQQQLGVFGAHSNTALDCLIRLDLLEFSQVFDAPQQSRGVLHGSVSLVDARRQVMAERRFTSTQPAPTADARGGVSALVAASEDLGRQLAGWLNGLEQGEVLKNCRAVRSESQGRPGK